VRSREADLDNYACDLVCPIFAEVNGSNMTYIQLYAFSPCFPSSLSFSSSSLIPSLPLILFLPPPLLFSLSCTHTRVPDSLLSIYNVISLCNDREIHVRGLPRCNTAAISQCHHRLIVPQQSRVCLPHYNIVIIV